MKVPLQSPVALEDTALYSYSKVELGFGNPSSSALSNVFGSVQEVNIVTMVRKKNTDLSLQEIIFIVALAKD